jgi:hypothetical protein
MRRLFRLFLAIALGIPLAGSIAFDGVSAVAAPVACTAGTPAPADPYPGTTAAATNFESGTLSPFIPFTAVTGTVSVSSAFSHSKGCSAYLHATQDNGSIANMSVGLAAGMKEAYADGWFNITKQGVAGNDVPYFRFFSSGIRFVDVFRHNITNDLVLRITGAKFIYTTLVPSVALGTWHHLVMHVVPKGAATGLQIWWDNKSVFAQTINISATSFDKVQLGAEHDQQMGDIYADDVIINSGAETPGPVPGTLPSAGGGTGGGGGGGTVPPAATTAIKAAAAAKPALGPSTSPIICGLVKGGCYQRFQAGTIHYAPGVGAFATWGAIRAAWGKVGYEKGKLGYPVSKEICGLVKGGCYQRFQGGTIHYAPGVGAFATWGGIQAAWAAQGYEHGRLGYPTTNEFPIGGGSVAQNYQGGRISWSPVTGTRIT